MRSDPGRPFGRVLTAMVTPFDAEGALDLKRAEELAAHLVELGNDGLVVNGTTGEGPTTTDEEKAELVRAVVAAVGERATVVAGAGTYDTAHSVHLARAAEQAGAHGLLVVTPYYSRPPQEGLLRALHGGRRRHRPAGDALRHPAAQRRPDRAGHAAAARRAPADRRGEGRPRRPAARRRRCSPPPTSPTTRGDDPMNLPWLAVGAAGFVSVIGHVVADRLRALLDGVRGGRHARAREINTALLPVSRAMDRVGGVVFAKAALRLVGLDVGEPRLPLPPADDAQMRAIAADLAAAGLPVTLPS